MTTDIEAPSVARQATDRRGPLAPAKPRPLKALLVRLFEHTWGAKLAGVIADMRFALFRWRYPDASYADFYARTIAARLMRGGSHKTLGARKWGSGPLWGTAPDHTETSHGVRGLRQFKWFLGRGLRRDMVCVDYGCGSLRVGQHFIRYLDTGCYHGVDMVERFYRDGQKLIGADVIADKAPHFAVIEAAALVALRQVGPDLVYSTAVLQHVPPKEILAFFSSIVSMMGIKTVAAVNFHSADKMTRIGANSWAHTEESVLNAIAAVDSGMTLRIERWMGVSPNVMVLLCRDADTLARWQASDGGVDSH